MPIHASNIYSKRCDTQHEISCLKSRLAAEELKLKDLEAQIAEQAPKHNDDKSSEAAADAAELAAAIALELAEEIAEEQQELELLRKQVTDKVAEIYRLKQQSVAGLVRGGHSVVRYHIILEGEYYRYNLRGDMFEGCSDKFVGHWNGTTLDRSATPPESPAAFPSFYETKEFTG